MKSDWTTNYSRMLGEKLPTIIDNDFIDAAMKEDIFVRWGFCWCNLEKHDLSKLDEEHLSKLTFNSSTKWPSKDKMPKGFYPEKIIKEGKGPMLNIKELHKSGITGKGVIVAVMDSEVYNPNHIELAGRDINYTTHLPDNERHFHGDCVLANLCGKTVGVAPNVKVIYYPIKMKGSPEANKEQIERLESILYRLKSGEKIKILSRSGPLFYDNFEYDEKEKDKSRINFLINEIESYGCKVLNAREFGKNFHCGHYFYCDDKQSIDNIKMASWLKEENAEQFKQHMLFVCGGKCVPEWNSIDGYQYNQDDCFSWSIPQATGLYALCLQVNPNLTFDKFVNLCELTCDFNIVEFKIVNPVKVVEKSKELLKCNEKVL